MHTALLISAGYVGYCAAFIVGWSTLVSAVRRRGRA